MADSPLARDTVPAAVSHISPWLTPLIYQFGCRVVMPFYFGAVEIVGQEHLPPSGPVILAPTHRSRWDALLVAMAAGRKATGRDLRFMVSADEVTGFQGWFIRRLGGFPIDPKRPAIASLRHGIEILENQEMMVIFPEGGIFRDCQVHPLKPGLARLALQAESLRPGLGVNIVPICLHYQDPYPTWRSQAKVCIGRPLSVENYHQGSVKCDAQHLTRDLSAALKKLNEHELANPVPKFVARQDSTTRQSDLVHSNSQL